LVGSFFDGLLELVDSHLVILGPAGGFAGIVEAVGGIHGADLVKQNQGGDGNYCQQYIVAGTKLPVRKRRFQASETRR
jgi:hypothetical protein